MLRIENWKNADLYIIETILFVHLKKAIALLLETAVSKNNAASIDFRVTKYSVRIHCNLYNHFSTIGI